MYSGELRLIKSAVEKGDLISLAKLMGKVKHICITSNINLLYKAIEYGHLNIVQWLIRERIYSYDKLRDRSTILHSVNFGQLHILQYIIAQEGLGINELKLKDNAILRFAFHADKIDIVKWIMHLPEFNDDDLRAAKNDALCDSIRTGKLDLVKYIMSRPTFGIHDLQYLKSCDDLLMLVVYMPELAKYLYENWPSLFEIKINNTVFQPDILGYYIYHMHGNTKKFDQMYITYT